MLDNTQKRVIDLFNCGYNLFITGAGGRGKSFLLDKIVENYRKKNVDSTNGIVITSTTGLSAINIGGQTVHSWAGIVPSTELDKTDPFIYYLRNNNRALNKWRYTRVLIIDEISMLTDQMLDFLDTIAKNIRASNKPFGGIQVIFTGDFFQLPPVSKNTKIPFAFNAKCWKTLIDYTITLKKCYRQNETDLVSFLDKIRIGHIDESVKSKMKLFNENLNYNENFTHLYPTKAGVNYHNKLCLDKLKTETHTFKANIRPKKTFKINLNKDNIKFPNDTSVMEILVLKIGSFIIINKNIDLENGLVNGTQGILKSINYDDSLTITTTKGFTFQIKKDIWEFPNYYIEQYPIRLAWAITIHKSQGMGIDRLSVDIGSNIFSEHQVYVALSRATNGKYLHIKKYDINSIRINRDVVNYYLDLKKKSNNWIQITDENSKIYYCNQVNGLNKWKLPKGTIIVDKPNVNPSKIHKMDDIFNKKDNLCKYCNTEQYDKEYENFFGEYICIQCISKNNEFKIFNKTQLYEFFKNVITKKQLNNIIDSNQLLYKSQTVKFGNRYGKSVKLYLVKHIKSLITDTERNNNKIDKYTKPIKILKSKTERLHTTKHELLINNKSIGSIAEICNVSRSTIYNYLVELVYNKSHNLSDSERDIIYNIIGFDSNVEKTIRHAIKRLQLQKNNQILPTKSEIKSILPDNIKYSSIHLVLLLINNK